MLSDELIFSFNEKQTKKYLELKNMNCPPDIAYFEEIRLLPQYGSLSAELKQHFFEMVSIISHLVQKESTASFFSSDEDKAFRKNILSAFFGAVGKINTLISSLNDVLSSLSAVMKLYTDRYCSLLIKYNDFLPYAAAFPDCEDIKKVRRSLEHRLDELRSNTEHIGTITVSSEKITGVIIPDFLKNCESALGISDSENFSYSDFLFVCKSAAEQIRSEIQIFNE